MKRLQPHRPAACAAVAAFLLAAAVHADESTVHIAAGPGSDLVRTRCTTCHSLDYIQMNSPFLTRTAWEAEVRKMIKVMGAPVLDSEVTPIVDYLTAHYGSE
ncbi:MAG: cytochrome c [Steroidobacterales bacterium]